MKCLAAQPISVLDKIKQRNIDIDTRLYHLAAFSVLIEKYGFGVDKIMTVCRYLEDRAESINYEFISITELEEILEDEYDISCKEYFIPLKKTTMGEVITSTAVAASQKFYGVGLASVLTDKLGYSKQKTQQIIKSVLKRADSLQDGSIDVDELKELLLNKYKVII